MENIEEVTFNRIARVRSASWLSLKDLCFHCGLKETEMRALTKRQDFPKPSAPTGTVKGRRWSKDEVNAWMDAHKLETVGDV